MGVYSNGVGSKDLVQDKLAAKPGTVKIEGTTQVGWTLTATVTGTSPADAQLSYEWRRGSTAIPGATGSSYKLTAADAGQTISARVSASHPDYTAATSAWSTATAKIAALDEPTPTTAKVTLSKVSLKSLTVGKKAVTAKWAKVAAKQLATKYQVQYRVKGKKAWKSKTVAATKAALKVAKLTKGKAYQFRVRAVRVVKSGTLKGTYYGPWSAVKTSKKVK
ncbi:MAG: fibronectin type III domain-containing protein [Propionibacteriaceae bacterium]|nr:fibronectin type III domain-containing protein [Propionibacteriaceae bacterium]